MEKDVEYLKAIITGLISRPDRLQIEKSIDTDGVLLTVHVLKEDMGHVIGRAGAVASSIRSILRHYGLKYGDRISIMIAEPK